MSQLLIKKIEAMEERLTEKISEIKEVLEELYDIMSEEVDDDDVLDTINENLEVVKDTWNEVNEVRNMLRGDECEIPDTVEQPAFSGHGEIIEMTDEQIDDLKKKGRNKLYD